MLKVLIVDDDPRILRGLHWMLRRHVELDVSTESFAEKAIDRMIANDLRDEPFDVVICDSRMPGVTGADVHHAVRLCREPAIFISMSGGDLEPDEADGNLLKPFTREECVEMIRRLVASRPYIHTRRLRPIVKHPAAA
jgi:DNA-binding NarL/FixJ family response regulator